MASDREMLQEARLLLRQAADRLRGEGDEYAIGLCGRIHAHLAASPPAPEPAAVPLTEEQRKAISNGISALRDRREWWAQFVDDKPGEALPGDPPPSTAACGRDMADRAIATLRSLLGTTGEGRES